MRPFATWLPRAALAALPLLVGCSEAYWTANIREVLPLPENASLLTNADIRTVNRIEGFERTRNVRMVNGKPLTITRHGFDAANRPISWEVPVREVHFTKRQFVCAEPSPDVARVVQAALSAAGTANLDVTSPVAGGLTGADALKLAASARLDATRSEAIAQLTRRIATIQLLRDGMYRACEAYANGAIGQEIYTAIVSRYDKIMVTMLLGEMASGNLPGMATAGGTSSIGPGAATTVALTEKLTDARKAQTAAETKLKAAIDEVAAKEKEVAAKKGALKDAKEADIASARAAMEKAEADLEAARKAQAIDRSAAEKARNDGDAIAEAIKLVSGQAGAAGQAAIAPSGAGTASAQVAEILYKMQREYLNDPQVGTQVLICVAEAAQSDDMGRYQKEFCDKIFATVFQPAGTLNSERAREVQLAELRNQGIALIMARLPATATDSQRREALRAAELLFPPPPRR